MSIRFWEGSYLIDVEVCSIPRDIPVVQRELSSFPQFYSAVGTQAQILSFGDCNADVLKTLDKDSDRKCSIHYPFCV